MPSTCPIVIYFVRDVNTRFMHNRIVLSRLKFYIVFNRFAHFFCIFAFTSILGCIFMQMRDMFAAL